MAGLSLLDIFKRLKKLQNGEMKCINSLIYTLRTYLTQIIPNATELDALLSKTVRHDEFIPSEQYNGHEAGLPKTVKFGEVIVEVLAKYSPSELAPMILQLPVFMDYIGSGMFEVIKSFPEKTAEDVICLVFYLMKRNDVLRARAMFDELNHDQMKETLQKHYKLLFESTVNSKGMRVVNFADFTDVFFLSTTNVQTIPVYGNLFTDICLYVLTETQFLDYETLLKMFMDYLSALIGNSSYINGQNLVQNFLEKYFLHINVKRCLGGVENSTKNGDDYTSMDVLSSNSEPTSLRSINDISASESDNSLKKSIRILIRLYLTHLKYATSNMNLANASHQTTNDEGISEDEELRAFDEKIDNFITRYKSMTQRTELSMHNTKKILFFEHRFHYLTLMPPFEENILTEGTKEPSQIRKLESDTLLNVLKLQSILCNQELSSDLQKDVLQFLQQNSDLIGADSILSCLYPTNIGVEFILEKCPQAVLEYAINKFRTDAEWISLLKFMQNKMNLFDEAGNLTTLLLYYRIFKGESLEVFEYNPLYKPFLFQKSLNTLPFHIHWRSPWKSFKTRTTFWKTWNTPAVSLITNTCVTLVTTSTSVPTRSIPQSWNKWSNKQDINFLKPSTRTRWYDTLKWARTGKGNQKRSKNCHRKAITRLTFLYFYNISCSHVSR